MIMFLKSTGMRLSLFITHHHSDLPPQLTIFPASFPASLCLAPLWLLLIFLKRKTTLCQFPGQIFPLPKCWAWPTQVHAPRCQSSTSSFTLPPSRLTLAFFQFLPEPISSPFYCLLQAGLSSWVGVGGPLSLLQPLLFFSSQFRHPRE